MTGLHISGKLLARNVLLNLIGQAAPLLIGVVSIPLIVRWLGTERFGLLSLAWVILGYFSIFDLGLGRATSKYAAEALGKGETNRIPGLVWTAVTVQGVLALAGALALMGITPTLVGRVMNIPRELVGEAEAIFYLLALAIPVVLVSGSFSGILEAAQRFDLVNAVRIPSNASLFLLPLAGVAVGLHLPGGVAAIVTVRFVGALALVALAFRLLPNLTTFSPSFDLFPRLFTYSAWVTVTSVVGPILMYLDRFLIASLLPVAAVAYYTAPYEAVTRLWIIPVSLTMALFPAFSVLEGIGDRRTLETLFARSVKYTLLVLTPVVLTLGLFAKEILQTWLGDAFAAKSPVVMQILAVGVLVNSVAHVPYTILQGLGRPDIPAKLHLLELPLHAAIAWVLVSRWGIVGAAVAWTLRIAFDALLLFSATFKVCNLSPRLLAPKPLSLTLLAVLLLVGGGYGLKSLAAALPVFVQSLLFVILFGLFAWIVWETVLDASDRGAVRSAVKLWQGLGTTP